MDFFVRKQFISAMLVFFALLFPLALPAVEQYNKAFSFELREVTLKDLFRYIEKNSDYVFLYASDKNLSKKVNVDVRNKTVREILDEVLEHTGLVYEIDGKQVIVKERKASEVSPQQSSKMVSGLVTDMDGNPVIGATVTIAETSAGVITDVNGRYSIKVDVGKKLIFKYLGYVTEERVVKDYSPINVRLLESSTELEDVVIIGYGQQKKESVVASMNSISSEELATPGRSLTNSLAGQVSGIIAVQRSGEPGNDDSSFWIRGVNSFQANNSPLVLVDGIPRAMADIEPDEIETLTVLKDASATAVYGAEGANGVILITSKRGATQKPRLNVRAEFGVVSPTRLPEMVDSYDWAKLYNEAAWNDKGNPKDFVNPYSDEVLNHYLIGDDPDLYPNSDFLSLLNDRTFNQRVTLNLRGGAERVRYFVSGAFYNESGIFDSQTENKYDANIGYSRYNIRSNIDMDVTKTTKLAVDMSGQYANKQNPGATTDVIFKNLLRYAPNEFPLVFSDGTLSEHPNWNNYNEGTCNPYNQLNNTGYSKTWTAAIQSAITLTQNMDFITKGLSLKLKGSFDADMSNTNKRTYDPTTYKMVLNDNGEREYVQIHAGTNKLTDLTNNATAATKKIYLEASLNYTRKFADKHDVSGMLLYMQKETKQNGVPLPYRKQSFVGRFSYGYDSRYMIESSFGMTGSENFAPDHRWGIFPSVGGAWYISNEKFMRPLEDVISKLKLRASIGLTGFDKTANRFPYRASFTSNGAGFSFGFSGGYTGSGASNGTPAGVFENLFYSPFISWEIETKRNVGLDLGLFRGAVDLSADFFKNSRKDILMQRKTVSGVTGFRQAPWQNFGKMENIGFDGNIVVKQNINKLMLTFRGNVTYAHNKVTEYDEVNPAYEYQRYTGHILNKPLLYIADGLYTPDDFTCSTASDGTVTYTLKDGLPKTASEVRPGDIKYRDLNGDNEINAYDRTYDHEFYSQSPEWVYGFGMNVDFRGFYVSCLFQGTANSSVNLNAVPASFVPNQNILANAVRKEVLTQRWTPENPYNQDVLWPRLHSSPFTHNNEASTWWYRKGDFLRLKNVEFGYQFDKKMLQRIKVQNARVYIQGTNLCVWDHIKMWDPELGNANSGAKYPLNRTWMLGLEIGF